MIARRIAKDASRTGILEGLRLLAPVPVTGHLRGDLLRISIDQLEGCFCHDTPHFSLQHGSSIAELQLLVTENNPFPRLQEHFRRSQNPGRSEEHTSELQSREK